MACGTYIRKTTYLMNFALFIRCHQIYISRRRGQTQKVGGMAVGYSQRKIKADV